MFSNATAWRSDAAQLCVGDPSGRDLCVLKWITSKEHDAPGAELTAAVKLA